MGRAVGGVARKARPGFVSVGRKRERVAGGEESVLGGGGAVGGEGPVQGRERGAWREETGRAPWPGGSSLLS